MKNLKLQQDSVQCWPLEEISNIVPQLIGGSADLSGSNNTKTKNSIVINNKNFSGNYIHYGVREHGMAAIMNGLACIMVWCLTGEHF